MSVGIFRTVTFTALSAIFLSTAVFGNDVQIEDASVRCVDRICSFEVTLKHADTGWDHYADHWRVLDAEENELGRRTLYHPHVDEQPFTRSLGNIQIPDAITELWIEAHDKVHGYSSDRFKLNVPE